MSEGLNGLMDGAKPYVRKRTPYWDLRIPLKNLRNLAFYWLYERRRYGR